MDKVVIIDAESTQKCAYEPCDCMISMTQDYCSAHCADADNIEEIEIKCDCGHDTCSGN